MRFLCKKVRVSQLKTGYNFCAPGPAMQHSRAGFSSRIQGKTGTRNETGRFAAKPLPQTPKVPNRVWRFLLGREGEHGAPPARATKRMLKLAKNDQTASMCGFLNCRKRAEKLQLLKTKKNPTWSPGDFCGEINFLPAAEILLFKIFSIFKQHLKCVFYAKKCEFRS